MSFESTYSTDVSSNNNKVNESYTIKQFILRHKSTILSIISVSVNVIVLSVVLSDTKSDIDKLQGSIVIFQNVVNDYINNAPKIHTVNLELNEIINKLSSSNQSMIEIDTASRNLRLLDVASLNSIGNIVHNLSQLKYIVNVLSKTGGVDYNEFITNATHNFKPIRIYSNYMVGPDQYFSIYVWSKCDIICQSIVGLSCCFEYINQNVPTKLYQNQGLIAKDEGFFNIPSLILNMSSFLDCAKTLLSNQFNCATTSDHSLCFEDFANGEVSSYIWGNSLSTRNIKQLASQYIVNTYNNSISC